MCVCVCNCHSYLDPWTHKTIGSEYWHALKWKTHLHMKIQTCQIYFTTILPILPGSAAGAAALLYIDISWYLSVHQFISPSLKSSSSHLHSNFCHPNSQRTEPCSQRNSSSWRSRASSSAWLNLSSWWYFHWNTVCKCSICIHMCCFTNMQINQYHETFYWYWRAMKRWLHTASASCNHHGG